MLYDIIIKVSKKQTVNSQKECVMKNYIEPNILIVEFYQEDVLIASRFDKEQGERLGDDRSW